MPAAPRPSRPRKRDGGAAAVEAAIVLPVILLVLFGIIEFGLYFKDDLAISSGVRAGARLASTMPTGKPVPPSADSDKSTWDFAQYAAEQVGLGMGNVSVAGSPKLYVYDPGPGSTARDAGDGGACAVSRCITFTWDATTRSFVRSGGTWNLCADPTARDRVAVQVDVVHRGVTGFIFSSLPIEQRAVLAFEPTSTVASCS